MGQEINLKDAECLEMSGTTYHWPFLWGENELIIDSCSAHILLVGVVNKQTGN